jgi:hypothetical protein
MSIVGFISTQELAIVNKIQLDSKYNNMYNNGNKLIVNLKTSNSKPNSNNNFANKYKHPIFLFWSKLSNGYGQVDIPKDPCNFLYLCFGHLQEGYGQVDIQGSFHSWSNPPCFATFYTLYILTKKNL